MTEACCRARARKWPIVLKKSFSAPRQFSKSRWWGWRFETWGSASTKANSFTDLARRAERALLAEVGSRFSFAQMLPIPHFRLFQHNPPKSRHRLVRSACRIGVDCVEKVFFSAETNFLRAAGAAGALRRGGPPRPRRIHSPILPDAPRGHC
jgi:hypothetical protein